VSFARNKNTHTLAALFGWFLSLLQPLACHTTTWLFLKHPVQIAPSNSNLKIQMYDRKTIA
jgi:hypothetical protein